MKKLIIGIAAVVFVVLGFLAANVYVKNDKDMSTGKLNAISSNKGTSSDTINKNKTSETVSTALAAESSSSTSASNSQKDEPTPEPPTDVIENSFSFDISNNSPEFDLKASLDRYQNNKLNLHLQYYLDGQTQEKEIGITDIPQLSAVYDGIKASPINKSNFISINLNPQKSKSYIFISDLKGEFPDFFIYTYDLKTMVASNVYQVKGKLMKVDYNKNNKYLAINWMDNPASSVLQESRLLDILDLQNDKLLVSANRTISNKLIGSSDGANYFYDYEFTGWKTNSIMKLKRMQFSKKDSNKKPIENELLYDIEKDQLLEPDGSLFVIETAAVDNKEGTNLTPQASPKPKTEEEPVKLVRTFYFMLSKGQSEYSKAMELLDDKFELSLSILTQFGVDKLTKTDISAEGVEMYSQLLMSAMLDSVVKCEVKGDKANIEYYQIFASDTATEVPKQHLFASLVKSSDKWKILSVVEK